MTHPLTDHELEARLVATFDEVIPRLRALQPLPLDPADERAPLGTHRAGPAGDGLRPFAGACEVDRSLDGRREEVGLRRRSQTVAGPRRHVALVAAAIGIVAGAGVLWAAGRGPAPEGSPPAAESPAAGDASAPAADAPVAAFDPTTGSPLTAAMPAGTPPLVVADGWAYSSYTGVQPYSADPPSAFCPGCGADRLMVAADGPLFSGPLFTAWVAPVAYEPADMDWPVTIGGVEGRFMGATDPPFPADENRVTAMWPVGNDRTAYVDAVGLSNDDVFALAAALDTSGDRPTMTPPAGFHLVDAHRPDGASFWYGTLDDPVRTSTGMIRTLQVYATDAGLQALVDWRYPTGRLLIEGWTPQEIDGTTVAFHDATADPESAGNASAIWIAGDWAYVVVGQRFTSGDDFAAALRSLHLADQATFGAATAGAAHGFFPTIEEDEAGHG